MPEDEHDRERIKEMGLQDPGQLLLMQDFIKGDDIILLPPVLLTATFCRESGTQETPPLHILL